MRQALVSLGSCGSLEEAKKLMAGQAPVGAGLGLGVSEAAPNDS